MKLRDELGMIYADEQFSDLFPERGQPAESPARLALVTVLQFAEGLTNRQAADAVRGRIDWKSALGLELSDPGFDFSVLSEFRSRLLAGSAEERLLSIQLKLFRAGSGKGRRPPTHRLDARLGDHPPAQPARTGRRKPAPYIEHTGAGGAGLAGDRGPARLVRTLWSAFRLLPSAGVRANNAKRSRSRSGLMATGSGCGLGVGPAPGRCGALPPSAAPDLDPAVLP